MSEASLEFKLWWDLLVCLLINPMSRRVSTSPVRSTFRRIVEKTLIDWLMIARMFVRWSV